VYFPEAQTGVILCSHEGGNRARSMRVAHAEIAGPPGNLGLAVPLGFEGPG
jgi:hypothetical protein